MNDEPEIYEPTGVAPCYECPHIKRASKLARFFGSASLCAHPRMRHPVSGVPYLRCDVVRGMHYPFCTPRGVDGHTVYCLGYYPEMNEAVWSARHPA